MSTELELRDLMAGDQCAGLNTYQRITRLTDRMGSDALSMPILGLFGEVGSLLSELKKKRRDQAAYARYHDAVIEEMGDVLWYFANIASRANLNLSILAQRMSRNLADWDQVQNDEFGTFDDIQSDSAESLTADAFQARLIDLAGKVGDLVNDFGAGKINLNRDALSFHLVEIFRALVAAADAGDISLADAARRNIAKIVSHWPIEMRYPPLADEHLPRNERLPRRIELAIAECETNGKTYVIQKCHGIIIGDRLTDNKVEKDDYRFHDVFHLAYATFLGWSPVLRALFRVKRKSDPELDENQDGARAIIIEEGITTIIFSRALKLNLFEGLDRVDYSLLKSIQEFVRGYEVERCALWQWEAAILQGFDIFRQLKKRRRGLVIADLEAHTLEIKELDDER